MAKLSRPVMYGGLLVLVVAAYAFVQGGDAPSKGGFKGTSAKSSSKSKDIDLTKEDYSAKFAEPHVQVRNVFMPLVMRAGGKGGPGGIGGPVNIPSELTLGEQNWAYTGMAEVNSIPQALVENTVTGDGVFLKQGERWKDATVFQITPDVLTLIAADGVRYEVKVLGSQDPVLGTPAPGFQPLAVAPAAGLQGPIGAAGAAGDVQVQPTRRGRGGRGGGGFGGGAQPASGGDTTPGTNGFQPSPGGDPGPGGGNIQSFQVGDSN